MVSNATQNFRSTARSQFAKSASDEHKKSPSKLETPMDPGQVSRRGERAKEEHKRSGDVPAGDFLPLPVAPHLVMPHQPGPRAPEPVRCRRRHARRRRREGDDDGRARKKAGMASRLLGLCVLGVPARTPAARNAGLSSSTRATQKNKGCAAFRAPGHGPLSQVESHALTAQASTARVCTETERTSGTRKPDPACPFAPCPFPEPFASSPRAQLPRLSCLGSRKRTKTLNNAVIDARACNSGTC